MVHRHTACVLAILLLVSCTCSSEASEGDASDLFQQCHSSCPTTGCTKTPGTSNTCDIACPGTGRAYHPPWTLLLMGWDCDSDCAYHCMWAIEGPKASAAAGPVFKYYGKWPFTRVLGVQEIASVAFSLANLLAHVHNLHLYLQLFKASRYGQAAKSSSSGVHNSSSPAQYAYYGLWVVYALVNINAWLWSSIFHCRDTRITERFDYFSADLVVVVGLGVVVARALQLTTRRQLAVLALLLGAVLLQHVHYMAFVKFDYGYNMTVCIAAGIATAVAWLVWVTKVRHPGRWTLYKFMALMHMAMLLEVLDFPPLLWLFDAHALWHAATVPLTYFWYAFIATDVMFWQQQQQHAVGSAAEAGSRDVGKTGGMGQPHAGKQKQ